MGTNKGEQALPMLTHVYENVDIRANPNTSHICGDLPYLRTQLPIQTTGCDLLFYAPWMPKQFRNTKTFLTCCCMKLHNVSPPTSVTVVHRLRGNS